MSKSARVFPPPTAPALWERVVRQALAEAAAWAALYPTPAAPQPAPRRRKRAPPRQVRAIVRNVGKAGLNLDRIEIDSTSGRVTALVNTGGEPTTGNGLDAEIAELDRRLYGEPRT